MTISWSGSLKTLTAFSSLLLAGEFADGKEEFLKCENIDNFQLACTLWFLPRICKVSLSPNGILQTTPFLPYKFCGAKKKKPKSGNIKVRGSFEMEHQFHIWRVAFVTICDLFWKISVSCQFWRKILVRLVRVETTSNLHKVHMKILHHSCGYHLKYVIYNIIIIVLSRNSTICCPQSISMDLIEIFPFWNFF